MPTDQYKVFDYLGTAGSIIDLGIFQDPFWKSIPVEFKNVEDLWLCFVLQRFGQGDQRRRPAPASPPPRPRGPTSKFWRPASETVFFEISCKYFVKT